MKKLTLFILSLMLMVSMPLQASEESHLQAAKEMVEIAKLDKMLDGMYQQMNAGIVQSIMSQDPCLEPIRQPLTELLLKYNKKMINPELVKNESYKLYKDVFSEAELHELTAFYKTPTGQKSLEKSPVIFAKSMEIAQKEIDKSRKAGVMDELQKEIGNLVNNIDVSKLSGECKKQHEDRKAKMKELKEAADAMKSSNTLSPAPAATPAATKAPATKPTGTP